MIKKQFFLHFWPRNGFRLHIAQNLTHNQRITADHKSFMLITAVTSVGNKEIISCHQKQYLTGSCCLSQHGEVI